MDYVGTHICVDNVKTKNFEKRKSHITFGTAEATKLVFGMFFANCIRYQHHNSKIPKKIKRNLYQESYE